MFKKLLLPPDVFFRHFIVSKELQRESNILDVGGSLAELKKFLPNSAITTADVVHGADVRYDGKHLPFPDNTWDAVVSVDTLEHVPSKNRLAFVKELTRVVKRKVILIAPYKSEEHERYEGELVYQFRKSGKKVPAYLLEHRKHGLVSDELCVSIKKDFPASIRFIGLVSLDRINFKIHTFEFRYGPLNRFTYAIKFLWNIAENIMLSTNPSFVLNPPLDQASRVIIDIEKS